MGLKVIGDWVIEMDEVVATLKQEERDGTSYRFILKGGFVIEIRPKNKGAEVAGKIYDKFFTIAEK